MWVYAKHNIIIIEFRNAIDPERGRDISMEFSFGSGNNSKDAEPNGLTAFVYCDEWCHKESEFE